MHGAALDVPGPGRPTPEEAAAPYLDGYSSVVGVEIDSHAAEVVAESVEGGTVRVMQLSRREDGWWPDGFVDCVRR